LPGRPVFIARRAELRGGTAYETVLRQ